MKSTEFCYWLQGYFELKKEQVADFNEDQTQTVKNHLNMVFAHDPQPMQFCAFLRGYFTISDPITINEVEAKLIQQELQKTFKNEIDSRYSKTQFEQLNKIHQQETPTKPKLPPGIEAMC